MEPTRPNTLEIVSSNKNYVGVYLTNGTNWYDARLYCQREFGTDLASIHTESQNTEAASVVYQAGYLQGAWIGLNDILNESIFIWSDNTSFNYSSWHPDEPNNLGDEDCGEINFDTFGKWNDERCYDLRHWFICNYEHISYINKLYIFVCMCKFLIV